MKRSQELVGRFSQQKDARQLGSSSLSGDHAGHKSEGEIPRLAAALAKIRRLRPTKPSSAQSATEFDTNLIAAYLAGTLDDKAKEEIEALLANNSGARHYLVELARLEKRLASHEHDEFHEEISEQEAAKIVDRLLASPAEPESPNPVTASKTFVLPAALTKLAVVLATRRSWQFGALALGIVVIGAVLFRPAINRWYSDKFAKAGMQALTDEHTLPEYAARLSGNFLPAPAGVYRSQGDQAQDSLASRQFAASLRWNAENVVAKRGQALIAYFGLRYEEAFAILQKLLQDSAQDSLLLNDLGVVAAALDQQEQALSYFERALTYHPYFTTARFNRAVILEELERIEPAIRAWQEYLDLSENSPWAEVALDRLQKLQRNSPRQ